MSIIDPVALAGAQVCLDFINTVNYRLGTHPQENLPDYGSLLEWAWRADLVDAELNANLNRQAVEHPLETGKAWQAAIQAREVLFHLLASHIAGEQPLAGDVELFNHILGEVLSRLYLHASPAGYHWDWRAVGNPELARAYWPVVRAAAELLTSPALLERLGQCADPHCGWLFFDTSKNHSRKWCDINDCGNRAKQRRYRGKG